MSHEFRDPKPYAAPKLTVYGKVADLTANGNSNGVEGNDTPGSKNKTPKR